MYIWIHDKYSSTSFKQRLWQIKIALIWQNYFFQIMCVTVVQWSRSFMHVQINWVRLPATLLSVSLYRFFPCLVFFLTLFFLLAFFSLFLLQTLLVMHLDQYIFLSLRYLHWQIFNILFCPQNLSTVSSDDVICISGVLFLIYLRI